MKAITLKRLNGFLFWFHVCLILGFLFMGLYFPLSIVIGVLVLQKIHMIVFNGCLLTKLQRSLGHLPNGLNFIQITVQRIFRKEISKKQGVLVDLFLSVIAIMVAVL